MALRSLIGKVKRRLLGQPEPPPPLLPDQQEIYYKDGVRYFEAGELDKALAEFSAFLRFIGCGEWVAPETPPFGLPNVHNYGDFDEAFPPFLEAAFARWEKEREPFPRFLRAPGTLEDSGSIVGKRLLALIPQYIMNSKRFIEADFHDHLVATAGNAGARAEVFYTDRCSYPGPGFDAALARTELERLAAKVAEFRPEIVVVDGNYVPSAESLNPALLLELKQRHPFRLVTFIGDAWGSHWVPAADAWGEASDAIFHFAPETPLEKEGKYPQKLCWSAYPVNERNFYPDDRKDLDISFVGTYVSRLRPFWLTVALQAAKDLDLRQRLLPHKREAQVALTMEEYAAVLRRSRMVLNFSTRLEPLKMMTGRTWQVLTAGNVLLEEENPFITAYFVPFVHYVPFATRNELAYSIRFFARRPEWAKRIGDAASAFCREHYTSRKIWSRLVDAASRA